MTPGRRYYRLLLRVLPPGFRRDHGPELLEVFEEMREELGPKPGFFQLVAFYLPLTGDVLRRVRSERARAVRRSWDGPQRSGGPDPRFGGRAPLRVWDGIRRDLRASFRSLTKRPAFLIVATLSLAIGIGANTALFSVVNAVFIRQYDFHEPESLVRLYTQVQGRTDYGSTSFPNYRDLRDFDEAFSDVAAFKMILSRIELEDQTVRVMGEAVSSSLFPMLGVEAAVGRTFLPEEDVVPGAHPVLMLGHGFWQRAFGGDPAVIGETLRIAGQAFTVVGVAPPGYKGLSGPGLAVDFFVPLVMYGVVSGFSSHAHFEDRLDRRYQVVGRLAEGLQTDALRARLGVFSGQIAAAHPEIEQDWAFSAIPLQDVAVDPDVDRAAQPFAILLMTAGGLVLLLACTNLASFLLAQGTTRRREVALRLALGAKRSALIRQRLTETVLMALLGGASGLLVARLTLDALSRFQPPLPVPIDLDIGMDMTVLLFTLGVSTLAGLFFGLAPALQSTKLEVAPTLRDEVGCSRGRGLGFRNGLVAFQVALSVILLVGGGLFMRSLEHAGETDLGFTTREAGIVWVDLSLSGVPTAEFPAVRQELTRRAKTLPGIEAVTAASHIPLLYSASGGFYTVPGLDRPGESAGHNVQREEVDPAFFETMGIPLLAGRAFQPDDRPQSQAVAIVNQTAATRFWPDESPLGREFYPLGSDEGFLVVGVVGDTKVEGLRESAKPLFYFPIAQSSDTDLILVARGVPAPEQIVAMLRGMIRDVDTDLMIMDAKTMEENVSVVLFPVRMAALLLGVFGAIALTLATIGLYGVVSFSVSQRTKEVGIRLSLGADSGGVIAMVMRGAMSLVGVGAMLGLAAGLGLAPLVRHVLYGVGPWDPATLLGVLLLLGSVAGLASYIPARRASRVDPLSALRAD